MCWTEIKDNINVQTADRDFKVYKIVSDANKQSCTSIIMGFDYTVNTPYYIPTIEYKIFGFKCKVVNIKKHTIVILGYISYVTLLFIKEQLGLRVCYLEGDMCLSLLKMRLI